MSNLAQPGGEDYPQAAAKHLEDAGILLREGRTDNSAYLAGYVIECVMKTLLQLEQGYSWEHDLDQLSQRAEELAALPGARTARYAPARTSGHSVYQYMKGGWSESMRYKGAGAVTRQEAQGWLAEAENVYDQVVGNLRLDGVVY